MNNGIALSFVFALASQAGFAATCSCDDLDTCTRMEGIPILFAKRDMVRATLKARGFRVVDEDDNRAVDIYTKPGTDFDSVRAYFDEEQQMADLSFEYPLKLGLELSAADNSPTPSAVLLKKRGSFAQDENSFKRWVFPDFVDLRLYRNRNDDHITLAFQSTAAHAHVADFLEKKESLLRQHGSSLALDGISQDEKAYAAPPGVSINPLQGKLTFTADAPVLLGKTQLVTDFCSASTDLDTHVSPAEFSDDERYSISGYRKPVDRVEVDRRSDSTLHIVLRLRDGLGNRYDFDDVGIGQTVHAQTRGDCRLRAVTVRYESIVTPQCLTANTTGRTPREIVQDVAGATGIAVANVELLPDPGPKFILQGGMSPDYLLKLVGEMTELYVDRIDAMHYSVRKPDKRH
jgi:hypothetical protein